ncbi:MAG: flagellar hook-basal body complex protein FliE [Planctomycetota bacterium]|nr:MAG: flagellar hook-basal body complex protein FliE [Planctomycetota bacterium]
MYSVNSATSAPRAFTLPSTLSSTKLQESGGFRDALLKSIDEVNSMQQQADQAVENMLTGGDADPAAVLTAVQKADLAFRMLMQMRNKVMQAYQEVKDIRI